ncbi:hypothetical protein THRCLA_11644, partial [Thraustotheca clavata]
QKGIARYLGVVKRGHIFRNPGKTAVLSGGLLGNITLQTVRSVNMYEYDMVEKNGYLDSKRLQTCFITITWKCQATMLTNSIVLFIMTFYLAILQFTFLQRSIVCCAPVYMSKNIVGLVILFIVFYNNYNVQALTTYLLLNPSYNQVFYALCCPVQVASIVGIMTRTIIQIWFNPQVVTQTWIIMLFSSINLLLSSSWKVMCFRIEISHNLFHALLQYQQIALHIAKHYKLTIYQLLCHSQSS